MIRNAFSKVMVQVERLGGKIIGDNVEPVITGQLPGPHTAATTRRFEVPVTPRFTKQQLDLLKEIQNRRLGDLGSAMPELSAEHLAQEREIVLRAHFEGGRRAMADLKIQPGHELITLVAGSGNDKEQAANMVNHMDPEHKSVKLSTTSGGWLQNVTRPMGEDQGSLNAAFIQGMVTEAAEESLNTVHSASFSQGSHATRDAQDALTDDQLRILSQAKHTTLGGSSNLRTDHLALTSKYDPVPLATHIDPFTLTASGNKEVRQGDNLHNGVEYADRFATEVIKEG